MPRSMSFALTTAQVLDRTKTVTRRYGWGNLKPGDVLWAVEKCMGLKKGEKVNRLALIEIVSVRTEPLKEITKEDCIKEGFPHFEPADFILLIMKTYPKKMASDPINRIEFKYLF